MTPKLTNHVNTQQKQTTGQHRSDLVGGPVDQDTLAQVSTTMTESFFLNQRWVYCAAGLLAVNKNSMRMFIMFWKQDSFSTMTVHQKSPCVHYRKMSDTAYSAWQSGTTCVAWS